MQRVPSSQNNPVEGADEAAAVAAGAPDGATPATTATRPRAAALAVAGVVAPRMREGEAATAAAVTAAAATAMEDVQEAGIVGEEEIAVATFKED